MNRERIREVLDKLAIAVRKSDGHGIEIDRTICPGGVLSLMEIEHWRLTSGGGIAGNSDQFWLAPVARRTDYKPRGPYRNKAQLEKALRAWRRGE